MKPKFIESSSCTRGSSYLPKISETTERIIQRLHKLPAKHQSTNTSLKAIRHQAQMMKGEGPLSQMWKSKMCVLYNTALKHCESEHAVMNRILADVQQIRQLRFDQMISEPLSRGSLMMLLAQHAASLPLYIGGVDDHPPPLVGAIPLPDDHPLEIGNFVAAFVDDVWILASIKSISASTNLYQIKDIDDENSATAEGDSPPLIVPRKRLIALPHHRADPRQDAHALFPVNAVVLALYPQTTCFYKGVVEQPPTGPTEDYQIAFEDSTFPSGYSPTLPVAQRYVVTFRDVAGSSGNESEDGNTAPSARRGHRGGGRSGRGGGDRGRSLVSGRRGRGIRRFLAHSPPSRITAVHFRDVETDITVPKRCGRRWRIDSSSEDTTDGITLSEGRVRVSGRAPRGLLTDTPKTRRRGGGVDGRRKRSKSSGGRGARRVLSC